jgi:hypothetical protein
MSKIPRYSDVETWRDRYTNALHVRYLGGQLDGVEVVVREDELQTNRYDWSQYVPVDVDELAEDILLPASEQVIDGSYVIVPRSALSDAGQT